MPYLPVVQPEEHFSFWPALVFQEAVGIERVTLFVPDRTGKREAHFLIFARRAYRPTKAGYVSERPDGTSLQCDIIAYECDEYGDVLDWESRFESYGATPGAAVTDICLQIVNGLLAPLEFHGALEKFRAAVDEFDAQRFSDWLEGVERLDVEAESTPKESK